MFYPNTSLTLPSRPTLRAVISTTLVACYKFLRNLVSGRRVEEHSTTQQNSTTMTTELELLTQIEVLKTDMGKVQASLRDAIVARDFAHKTLLDVVSKIINKENSNDCC